MIKREHDQIDELAKKANELLEKGKEKLENLENGSEDLPQPNGITMQKINLEEEKRLAEEILNKQKFAESNENNQVKKDDIK